LAAINTGDAAALEHLIGPGRGDLQKFQWVSLTESTTKHVVDYDADAARRTLLARAATGERWTLISVRSLGGTQWDGGVGAEVYFDRTLADGSVIRTHGKTALSCMKSAVYLLSLGNP